MEFEDIPWEDYVTRWGLRVDGNRFASASRPAEKKMDALAETEQSARPSAKAKPVPQQEQENVKRQRTRKTNEARKRQDIKQSLSPEDMRAEGLRDYLISGFDGLMGGKPLLQGTQK
jgi:hypothetical protein